METIIEKCFHYLETRDYPQAIESGKKAVSDESKKLNNEVGKPSIVKPRHTFILACFIKINMRRALIIWIETRQEDIFGKHPIYLNQ